MSYFLLFLGARCDKALPAAVLLFFEVFLLLRTFEAAEPAFLLVFLCFGTTYNLL